ncbi:response regulator transcription factor [Anaerosporobacter sp.]
MNTLLIVEDEKLIRQGIKAMALRSGVPISMVMECKNGLEALEIIRGQEIDVVITDIRMPKMDGITLVKEIQTCNHVPLIVVVSGYDDFSYAVELLRHGVKDYLLKPIERTQLSEILTKLEEELVRNQNKLNMMMNIGYQQLKQLMLNDNMDEKECELIINQFSSSFFDGEYIVYCTNYRDEFEETDGVTFLHDVNGQGIFIVDNLQKDKIVKSELRGYYVGSSRVHVGLLQIKEAYEEAKKARRQAFLSDSNFVIYDKEAEIEDGIYQEHEIEQIVQMIGTDKCEEALKMLDHICYQFKISKISDSTLIDMLSSIKQKTYTTYRNVLKEIKDEEFVEDLLRYDSLSQYIAYIKCWIRELNERLLTQFDDYRNKQKIQSALMYIKDNYRKDLNMAVVSNYISMNYSLFSYVFKQYTGCNFVNYLKQIRVDEAKRLLTTTDMKIVDISKAVGYDNDKHFMKIFKGQCGVSPTV